MNYNHDKFGKPSWKNLFRAVFYVDKKLSLRLASQHVHQGEVMTSYSKPTSTVINLDYTCILLAYSKL